MQPTSVPLKADSKFNCISISDENSQVLKLKYIFFKSIIYLYETRSKIHKIILKDFSNILKTIKQIKNLT